VPFAATILDSMEGNMSSLSEELAKKIASKLVKEKLILPEDELPIATKLSDGQLKPEDWRLTIEKNIDAKVKA
jgi:hypothetical protein